jgi:hypothetical protein
MADYFKHVKGHIAHITCYTKRAKPPFIKGLRQLSEEVRLRCNIECNIRPTWVQHFARLLCPSRFDEFFEFAVSVENQMILDVFVAGCIHRPASSRLRAFLISATNNFSSGNVSLYADASTLLRSPSSE